jgi:threonine/homoserine/homoserine lactone efflux protein
LTPPFPWIEIGTALAVFSANVLSPGPNVFNTIAIALGSGRRTALAVAPAVALGVLGWAAAAVLGAAALFREAAWLAPALSGLGGALLLVFAWRYARRTQAWAAEGARPRVLTPRAAFLLTLGVLASNPKALTTWLVLVTIFPAGSATPAAIVTMVLGAALLAGLIHAGYALAFTTRPAAAAYARAGRWITAAVAVFFAVLGASLLVRAAQALG